MRNFTLADLHGKRQNRALGAVSAAEKAEIELAHQPPVRELSPDFDVLTFDHRAKLTKDDENDDVLQTARRAYASLGQKLGEWHAREATIHANLYELPAKKRMLVSEMVVAEQDKCGVLPTAAWKECQATIEAIDREQDRAFRNRIKADEAREIRQHVKAMTKSERAKFLARADDDVVASVLAAKPFLSGLTDAEVGMFRHQAVAKWFPDELARRAKLKKAQELLQTAGERFLEESRKMVDKGLPEFNAQQAAMKKAVAGAE
jgi:hypothetical protein